jgi:hypothetical protein
MRGHQAPVGLLQVLANVLGGWVVIGMHLHSGWPMVCSPYHAHTGHDGTSTETTGTRKKVNGGQHVDFFLNIFVESPLTA